MRAKRSFRPSRRNFLAGTGAAIAALSFGPGFGRAAEEKKLNFYNWDTYIGETTLDDFRKATGISVKMDLFADNDELLAKLKNGNPGYDVIVPTNDYVERMIKAGMLMELDHAKIPNFKYLEKRFQDAKFDPGRKYSVTYMWGTIGIGYRPSKVKGTPDSWKYLYDSDEYAGRIALLAEAGTVIGCALQYLGYSFNSTSPEEINKAADLIIRQKKNIKTFAADNGQDLLASGEVDLTQEWNGDILQFHERSEDRRAERPLHPVRNAECGGQGADRQDAGRQGLSDQSGHLPAAGSHGETGGGRLSGRRARPPHPGRLDAHSGGMIPPLKGRGRCRTSFP